MEPRAAIVILNWNGWRDTIECLESIYDLTYWNFSVIVVDNDSKDDSVDEIKKYCEGKSKVESRFLQYSSINKPIKTFEFTREEAGILGEGKSADFQQARTLFIIKNERNYGFAEGNNIGIKFATRALEPDYFLLLNNDTVVDPNFLTSLVSVGEADKSIAILGPKIYYYEYEGRTDVIWAAGGMINPLTEMVYRSVGATERDQGQYEKIEERPWCSGAAMLIRGGWAVKFPLNSSYPFGHEDVEYCMEAVRRGAKVVYVPGSKVWHKVGASKKKTGYIIGRDVSGYFLFLKENFPRSVYFYHLGLFCLTTLPRWALVFAFSQRDKNTLHTFISDMTKFLRSR